MMEVDSPSSSSPSPVQNGTSLKRSNSAPMINLLVTSQPDASPPSMFKVTNSTALRRLSSSNMSLHNAPAASTSPPIRGTDRVARLKQEEIHIADRERQHEREIQSSFWISNNWGRLTFDSSEPMEGQSRRPRSYSESLHIMTQSNILCGSPSPTRAGIKQCFSPSMQIPVKNTTFTPSPSPSPTRKNFLRSLSPIAVRTGPLKRKLDQEGDRWEYISPPKKFHTGPSTPDRMMGCSHPLAHSISSSSLEGTGLDQVSVRPHNGSSGLTTVMSLAGRSPLAGHSPLSSCSGAPSPHTSLAGDSGGGLLGPGKPSFLFRPVAESVLGSPSSTSSSSSSSTTTDPSTLGNLETSVAHRANKMRNRAEEEVNRKENFATTRLEQDHEDSFEQALDNAESKWQTFEMANDRPFVDNGVSFWSSSTNKKKKTTTKVEQTADSGEADMSNGNSSQVMRDLGPPGSVGWTVSRNKNESGKRTSKEDRRRPSFWQEDIQVGCRELRARRYITDGFCTSEKPVKEVVCAGNCLPIMDMPWYAEFVKTLARTKLRDWQCVEDVVKKKRVKLLCLNGDIRVYRIKVVKSCKCKKISNLHNRTSYRGKTKKRRRRRRRRKQDRKNKAGRGS
ncbi:uncharacterized protein LOC101849282 [Aplysia californica]|uniref:Uncharacterized protein LOC101849282 n=1 Tax=Aplysia californica TaxID=6500 RepID=A0ABM0ZX17_APLCA|nr:uncharacterized protein LOC101849282 [Aplysia californica]